MSKRRGLAAFVLGALFAGALFELAVQQELVTLDAPLLLATTLAGGVLGLLLSWSLVGPIQLIRVGSDQAQCEGLASS